MTDDRNQTLRRLAKKYRITFRLPTDDWPLVHNPTFQNILKLGDEKFNSYSERVNIRSQDEPWTEQTKNRADWLAKRASRLFGQQRNEAGWRFGLENDILRRFSVEIACPKCRARLWRSEIEVSLHEADDRVQQLEQRRNDRQRCQCPQETRPQDLYEIGTNLLFDDRTQEMIIHDRTLMFELPRQEPDRVYGLQTTRNFEDLLSRPMLPSVNHVPGATFREVVRSSPFRSESDPLLFPFLVLEAKSESGSSGFDDIQVQTAFPIWALLKLQEDLQLHMVETESHFDPFVWFLASRGDAWRVYGCYVIKGENNEPTRYDITLLWSGSVATKDGALQLILIVDYILDWARDFYRPSILRQIKSIVTGVSYDRVSQADDSDIFSMRRNISTWIPAPPSTYTELEIEEYLDHPMKALEHQDMLPMRIPNTRLGSIRSALITEFRFVGLHLTVLNILTLLQHASRRSKKDQTQKSARLLVNFITNWKEMLLLTGADIEYLENTWTGENRPGNADSEATANTEFYVVLEFSCFISTSWDITKEISCVAISKPALETLIRYANFAYRHRPSKDLPRISRLCTRYVLHECIGCLRSGSPWQVLYSALSGTLLTLKSLPERKRAEWAPPVEHLGFEYKKNRHVKPFIEKFLETPDRISKFRSVEQSSGQSTTILSYRRLSEKRARAQEVAHSIEICDRCRQVGKNEAVTQNAATMKEPDHFAWGSILVSSLEIPSHAKGRDFNDRHDLCLFILGDASLLETNHAVSLAITDILQTDMLYHTIKHQLSRDVEPVDEFFSDSRFRPVLWNLPFPDGIYHPPTVIQQVDVMNWSYELLGQSNPGESQSEGLIDIWDYSQMILYLICSSGCSYLEAYEVLKEFNPEVFERSEIWDQEKMQYVPAKECKSSVNRVSLKEFYWWIIKQRYLEDSGEES